MEKRKRRFGDRNDGWLLRSLDPMTKLTPYIMPQRNDASNYFTGSAVMDSVDKYIRQKRLSGMKNFTILHLVLAAYVRIVSQRPALNRFIMGQKIYARNCFEAMLCIKKEMKLDGEESVLSMQFPLDATADEIYRIVEGEIEKARSETTSFDNTAKILDYIPGLLKKFAFWLLRVLDYCGRLPMFLKHISPFHGSLFITSMASLGLPPIFHHIYNFGNVPVFIAIGVPERGQVIKPDGTVEIHKMLNYSVVCDERICDGYYFASAFRLFNGIFRDPWQLDEAPEKVIPDVD